MYELIAEDCDHDKKDTEAEFYFKFIRNLDIFGSRTFSGLYGNLGPENDKLYNEAS